MAAYRQHVGGLALSRFPAVLARCPSSFSELQPALVLSRHVHKTGAAIRRPVPPSPTDAKHRKNREKLSSETLLYRRLVVPDVNPYTVIASQLVARESRQCARAGRDDSVVQRVKEYINVLKEQLEPAVDVLDEVVRRAVVRATDLWQPKKRSHSELLLRELAIDGGRKPKSLPAEQLPVRLKYALDGTRSLLDASNKLNLLCSILDRQALTPTADPGAALFGDYAFIQTTAGATQAPPPSAREASKAAGDLLPELIWPEGKEQEDLSLLALPSKLASRLSQFQLTQPVGRAGDSSVTHLATVTWDEEGVPAVRFHVSFFANPNLFRQPPKREQRLSRKPSQAAEKTAPGYSGTPYQFPPYLHHAAIMRSREAGSVDRPVDPTPLANDKESESQHVAPQYIFREQCVYDWGQNSAPQGRVLEWSGYYIRLAAYPFDERCTEPPALSQQLYVNHLARPLTCIARRDLATGHIMNFEGAVETKLDYRKKETLMQTDRALEAAVNVESREEFDSVRPFVEPETFVSAAVAQKDRPGGGPVEVAARAEFLPFWCLVDTRKSAACRIAPMEPCMWPTGFLDVMFPLVAPTPQLQVAPTHADQEMIRQHVDDTVLPWRLNKRYPTFSRSNTRDLSHHSPSPVPKMTRWWGFWSHGDVTEVDAQHEDSPYVINSLGEDVAVPNIGVYPIVTPSNCRTSPSGSKFDPQEAKGEGLPYLPPWLLEFSIKSAWSNCSSVREHTDMLRLLSNALLILRKEGWKLNEVLHGSVRMSQDLEARNLRQKQPETGAPLTSSLAFGVLPEIRIASRRSSSTLDRLKRTYKELHPFRSDEYMPFTSIDCAILVETGLPRPQDIDDFLPLRDDLRDVASEAVAMFKSSVQESHCRPAQSEDCSLD